MAGQPTVGTTGWAQALNEYLLVEHGSTGLHDLSDMLYDGTAYFYYATLDAVEQKVYVKFLTGTLDADSSTSVAHSVADVDKILAVTVMAYNSSQAKYWTSESFITSYAEPTFQVHFDATNIIISGVGVNSQGQNYRIRIDYYV